MFAFFSLWVVSTIPANSRVKMAYVLGHWSGR